MSQGSTSWGRKISYPLVDVIICNAYYVFSVWHHLVLPWLPHCWCVEWEENCSQTTIPKESCQHSQNKFMSLNRTNFNEVNSSQNCVSKRVRLWEILAARWIRSLLHLAFCFHKHKRYGNVIILILSFGLVAFCVLKSLTSGLNSDGCPYGRIKDKSVHKQTKSLSPYPCASNIHAALYSFF